MVLGLDSYSHHLAFERHMDLFSFIDKVSEYELAGFQIDPMHLASCDREYLKAVREEAKVRRLFIEHGMSGVNPADIERNVGVCHILGASILRTFIGFNRYSRTTDVRKELATARERLLLGMDALESSGVKLAIENHGDLLSEELVCLVEDLASPNVGICLDVGNSLCVLENPLEAARRMIPFVVSVHFKDYAMVGTPSGCKLVGAPLGQGVLPLQELYRVIVDEAPVTRLILEIPLECGHGEKQVQEREETAIRESVRYCREILGIGAA